MAKRDYDRDHRARLGYLGDSEARQKDYKRNSELDRKKAHQKAGKRLSKPDPELATHAVARR